MDYADQRYYASGGGRFLTPDPGGINTANPSDPASWNRYAYVEGDPVNFKDPKGLLQAAAEDDEDGWDWWWSRAVSSITAAEWEAKRVLRAGPVVLLQPIHWSS